MENVQKQEENYKDELVVVDIKYVTAPTLKELEKKVRAWINKNWTPTEAPVVIDPSSEEEKYIQTMVLEDYDE